MELDEFDFERELIQENSLLTMDPIRIEFNSSIRCYWNFVINMEEDACVITSRFASLF